MDSFKSCFPIFDTSLGVICRDSQKARLCRGNVHNNLHDTISTQAFMAREAGVLFFGNPFFFQKSLSSSSSSSSSAWLNEEEGCSSSSISKKSSLDAEGSLELGEEGLDEEAMPEEALEEGDGEEEEGEGSEERGGGVLEEEEDLDLPLNMPSLNLLRTAPLTVLVRVMVRSSMGKEGVNSLAA